MGEHNKVAKAIPKARRFLDLPFDLFERQTFSIWILSIDGRFLYLNPFADRVIHGHDILGKQCEAAAAEYPERLFATLSFLRFAIRNHKPLSLKSTSNIEATEVIGYPLEDCYCIIIRQIQEQPSLFSELKERLKRKQSVRL